MKAALVWCPFPTEDEAAAIADRLLDEHLIVCANLLPAVRSLYEWNGERGEARECGALFKTTPELLEQTVARIETLHSYAAPAVVGWDADRCGKATGAWLAALAEGRQ
ncbi:MAG: divalent-cation tolerance protein CutA [Candidatus Andeanibacterium colombiense]|uniref:Divalent-cation tolerance protein CutA n=1 Tax=Candidatus Andeanibacterium colombiense TaxID=3121345 RepID=A0AAJ6BN11_9SPHN|nr:MAG: divalent-cation tolerance protein CutA [Sphingomonadaceae bacterium]